MINTFFGLFWVGFFKYMLGGSGPLLADPPAPRRTGVPPMSSERSNTCVCDFLKNNLQQKSILYYDYYLTTYYYY